MSGTSDTADKVDAYVRYFETLTPDTIDDLEKVATPDVRFRDPFNDVSGLPAMRAVLAHMFEQVADPRFEITHRARAGDVAFIRWRFTGRLKALSNRQWEVIGMSELHLAPDGRIAAHIDHWDAAAQFYAGLPLIGPIIRLLQRRAGRIPQSH